MHGSFFKINQLSDFSIEIKFHFISEHLIDDSDKFAGTVSEGNIMCSSLRQLGIMISPESGVVFTTLSSAFTRANLNTLELRLGF